MSTKQRDYLLTTAVAEELDVSSKTLGYWRATNQGPPSYKVGAQVRYPRAEFEAWFAHQKAQTRRGDNVSVEVS